MGKHRRNGLLIAGAVVLLMGNEAGAQCADGTCSTDTQRSGGPQIIITGDYNYGPGSMYFNFMRSAGSFFRDRSGGGRIDRRNARIKNGYYLYSTIDKPIPWEQPPVKRLQKGGAFVVPPRPAPPTPKPRPEPIALQAAPEENETVYPRTFLGYLTKGDDCFMAGDFADALEAYRSALKWSSGNPAVLLALANTHFAVGDFIPAAEAMRNAMALWPSLAEVTDEIDSFYPEGAPFADCMQTLEEWIDRAPYDARSRFLAGAMYELNGDSARALAYLQSAQQLLPNDSVIQEQIQRIQP